MRTGQLGLLTEIPVPGDYDGSRTPCGDRVPASGTWSPAVILAFLLPATGAYPQTFRCRGPTTETIIRTLTYAWQMASSAQFPAVEPSYRRPGIIRATHNCRECCRRYV